MEGKGAGMLCFPFLNYHFNVTSILSTLKLIAIKADDTDASPFS